MSPASRSSTSPGTISAAGSTTGIPSRRTRARGAVSERSASRACSALNSWAKPTRALSTTMVPMAMASACSPIEAETAQATSRRPIIGERNCSRKTRQRGLIASRRISFRPYSCRRRAASAVLNPWAMALRRRYGLELSGVAIPMRGAPAVIRVTAHSLFRSHANRYPLEKSADAPVQRARTAPGAQTLRLGETLETPAPARDKAEGPSPGPPLRAFMRRVVPIHKSSTPLELALQ